MENFSLLSAISDGLGKKLNETFGDDYKIYPEKVEQGLERPCFFIKLIRPSNTKERDITYNRDNAYCIHFYPENTREPNAECYETLDKLYMGLEYIDVDGNPVRGINMLGEIHDEILQFYVNYNVRVRRVYEPVLMEDLEMIEFRTKG